MLQISTKHILFYLFFFCIAKVVQGQELSLYRNYLFNNYYNLNPAAAGFDGGFISQLTASKKWIGITGSPSNQVLSNSIRLGEAEFYDPRIFINKPLINLANRVGLGFTVFNETSGPLRNTGLLIAYAYHIPLQGARISFGLSGLIAQNTLSIGEFKPIETSIPDPVLYTNATTYTPDINIGAMYYNQKLYAGIAVNGLLNKLRTTYPELVLNGGYRIMLNSVFKVEPSLCIVRHGQGSFLADINAKLYYQNRYWLLMSYQGNSDVLAGFGIAIKGGLQLSYSYAINTTSLASFYQGSQCISLRADMARLISKH